MAPTPIFVKLKVAFETAGTYCFLGRKDGANVNLSEKSGILLATAEDEDLPVYRVSELIYADALRKIFVSFKDTDGYLHSRPILISASKATKAGLKGLVGQTYKTKTKSGEILKVRQKRKRTLVD